MMTRRLVIAGGLAALSASIPAHAQNRVWVDYDRASGKYYAYVNGRHVGPPFSSAAEAWAWLRAQGY